MLKELFQKSVKAVTTKTVTVEDVHREFMTASDLMLSEAKSVLASSVLDKGERLGSLGFSNSRDTVESEEIKKKIKLAKIIEKYMISDPFNKLITSEKVDEICAKYSLLHAEIHRFTGFVPEKNLREIESFVNRRKPKAETGKVFSTGWEKDSYMNGLRCKINLTICAPIKDMKLNQWEKVVGNKIEVPDPIVLFPVGQGCFLIVTAWGEEASDPEILNEKFN